MKALTRIIIKHEFQFVKRINAFYFCIFTQKLFSFFITFFLALFYMQMYNHFKFM